MVRHYLVILPLYYLLSPSSIQSWSSSSSLSSLLVSTVRTKPTTTRRRTETKTTTTSSFTVQIYSTRRRRRFVELYHNNNHKNNNNDDDNDDDARTETEGASEEEEEVDTPSCLPPGRSPEIKRIFLVSDATGVMARSVLLKTLAQFDACSDERAPFATTTTNTNNNNNANENDTNHDTTLVVPGTGTCDIQTQTFTFVRSIEALSQILQTAQEQQSCVMYTIADPQLRAYAGKECANVQLPHVDMMGPSLHVLSDFLDAEPQGIPALFTKSKTSSTLGDSYYQRIECVEFCLKADDGQSPWLLPEADIVLVGVSRSGKTPLSVVLSQTMSLKVANIPLVMEVPPPVQLLEQVDPKRVFCLTISPKELRRIRTNRLEKRGVKEVEAKQLAEAAVVGPPKSTYADRNYILKDLNAVRKLCAKYNWTEVDVTGRAVEETATSIVEMFNQRFIDDMGGGGFSNPHIG